MVACPLFFLLALCLMLHGLLIACLLVYLVTMLVGKKVWSITRLYSYYFFCLLVLTKQLKRNRKSTRRGPRRKCPTIIFYQEKPTRQISVSDRTWLGLQRSADVAAALPMEPLKNPRLPCWIQGDVDRSRQPRSS